MINQQDPDLSIEEIRSVLDVAQIADTSKRNKNGTIPSKDLKCVEWYRIKYGLKVSATNIWPSFTFVHSDGHETSLLLEDIKEEYRAFRRMEKNKRQVAA